MCKKNFIVNCFNLASGIILLFLLLTDIEFNSTAANFIFPLLVLISGFFSYLKITKNQKGKILFYLPSFAAGFGFYIVVAFLIIFNFSGCFFRLREETGKVRIQRCYSPDKIEYCDAYHYPVGAYSGGTGRVRIFLVNKYFPIVRKEVFYEPNAHVLLEDEDDIPNIFPGKIMII